MVSLIINPIYTLYSGYLYVFIGYNSGWWFLICFIFTPNLGEMIQFDEHIFQLGWFNHQLDQFMWPHDSDRVVD